MLCYNLLVAGLLSEIHKITPYAFFATAGYFVHIFLMAMLNHSQSDMHRSHK